MSHDPRAAYQCRDRRTEPVAEKHVANYCEYFEMIRREFVAREDGFVTSREAQAREKLKKLFGD